MILLAPVLLGVALVPLLGGRLTNLGLVRFRSLWLLPVAVVVQFVTFGPPPGTLPDWAGPAGQISSFALGFVVLYRNREIPGVLVLAAGAALNAAAIVANGGVMPASARAVAAAGIPEVEGFANSAVQGDPRLLFLGDVFWIPEGWPLANVFSVGDVVVVVAAVLIVHALSGSRLVPESWRERAARSLVADGEVGGTDEAGGRPSTVPTDG